MYRKGWPEHTTILFLKEAYSDHRKPTGNPQTMPIVQVNTQRHTMSPHNPLPAKEEQVHPGKRSKRVHSIINSQCTESQAYLEPSKPASISAHLHGRRPHVISGLTGFLFLKPLILLDFCSWQLPVANFTCIMLPGPHPVSKILHVWRIGPCPLPFGNCSHSPPKLVSATP